MDDAAVSDTVDLLTETRRSDVFSHGGQRGLWARISILDADVFAWVSAEESTPDSARKAGHGVGGRVVG